MSRTRHIVTIRENAADAANVILDGMGYGPKTFVCQTVADTARPNSRPTGRICKWDIEDSELAAIKAAIPNAVFDNIGRYKNIRKARDMDRLLNAKLASRNRQMRVVPEPTE